MISNCTREAKWHAQPLQGLLWTLPRVLAKGRESPEIGTIQPTKMTIIPVKTGISPTEVEILPVKLGI